MPIELMPYAGAIPKPKGRDRSYPIDRMAVGDFFFLPERKRGNLSSYFSHQGKKLGRKFATRTLHMRRENEAWVEAHPTEPDAVQGLGVWRTE